MVFRWFGKRTRQSEGELLALLAGHGIRVADASALAASRAEYSGNHADIELLLAAMGDEVLTPQTFAPAGWVSNDVWHFDAEAIEDHGDYVRIVQSLVRLASPHLDGLEANDFVDIEAGIAWIELKHNLATRRINLRVDNDWVDPAIFHSIGAHLEESGNARQFATHSLGQDCLVICKTPQEIRALNDATGLKFKVERA